MFIDGEFNLVDHDEIRWVIVKELDSYIFAAADVTIVNRLKLEILFSK
ncbi:hypothetical protein PV797_10740 [Clostridiaceae bacterium M8S5]|nr:hypothetical protein PV797_10740 [Clostridiaceae bacterium M8S5]